MKSELKKVCVISLLGIVVLLSGCQKVYYGTMEAFGKHKRDILVDDVEKARDAQTEAKEQFSSALAEFSAAENVMLPMRKLGRLPLDAMQARATELLSAVGLGEKTGRLPSQLSGGEQQRVAVARSLANQPSLLLADEPTGNLDAANSKLVFDLLCDLARKHRQAVVLVTHNHEIASGCDRILSMRDGVFTG